MGSAHAAATERLRNETVRRMLERSGPSLVATLRALESGVPVPAPPTVDFAARRREIMEQALGSMSREAARILYLGAKSALEADADYCVRMDRSMGGDPEPWAAVESRAASLDRRMTSLGVLPARRWPDTGPARDAATAHALASECVELADLIRPGWEWTQLERAIVLMARECFDEALALLTPLADHGFDDEVRYAALRNAGMCLVSMHREQESARFATQLRVMHADDPAAAFFEMEAAIATRDEQALATAEHEFAASLMTHPGGAWSSTLAVRMRHCLEGWEPALATFTRCRTLVES